MAIARLSQILRQFMELPKLQYQILRGLKMEKKDLRDYIAKGKRRIDSIDIEIKSISDYRKEYRSELDSIKYGRGSLNTEEYLSRYNAIKDKYSDIDSKDIIENALYLESKNIKKMLTRAAAALLVDELSRQPEKAINKPIHYKVFQNAFQNAKSEAWSNIEGLSDYFSSYIFKGCYGSTFDVNIRYSDYKVNLGHFIDFNTNIIDITGAIDFVEKFQYVEIDKIKDIVNEALETKALYKKKAMDLENERAAAMDKYKDIIVA